MPSARVREVRADLRSKADPRRAAGALRFFKTGPGEYGEGDRFIGLTLPVVRAAERAARDLSLSQALELLHSPWHEERLLALLLMVRLNERGSDAERRVILRQYLANTRYVNNWDLVDSSAAQIVGPHVRLPGGMARVERLAKSRSLWERRIAMLATFYDIRRGDVVPAMRVATLLLSDEHDHIHKAVGWMLREAEKRQPARVRAFLDRHAATMPRTALRYAIERFTPGERAHYMGMKGAKARSATPSSRRSRRSTA